MGALAATAAFLFALIPVTGAGGASARHAGRPQVEALPSAGRVGAPVRLRVWARTDGTAIRFSASIFRGAEHPFVVRTPFIRAVPVERLRWYYVVWSKPRPMRGTYPFCITGYDRAGKQSNLSCAPIRVR